MIITVDARTGRFCLNTSQVNTKHTTPISSTRTHSFHRRIPNSSVPSTYSPTFYQLASTSTSNSLIQVGSARAASKASGSFLTEINNVAAERYAQEVHTLMSCAVNGNDDGVAGGGGPVAESVDSGEEHVHVGDASAAAEAALSSLRLPPGIHPNHNPNPNPNP